MNKMEKTYDFRWEIGETGKVEYPTYEYQKNMAESCYGGLDIDIEALRNIGRICHEYGYSINSFIGYIIEHLTDREIDEILFKMDQEPRTEE